MSPVRRGLERHSGCKAWLVICIQRNIIQKAQHYASIWQLNRNVARNAETHSLNTTHYSDMSQWLVTFPPLHKKYFYSYNCHGLTPWTVQANKIFFSNYWHICRLTCMLLLISHVLANNNSHPLGECLRKGEFHSKTYHHQLCLVNDSL